MLAAPISSTIHRSLTSYTNTSTGLIGGENALLYFLFYCRGLWPSAHSCQCMCWVPISMVRSLIWFLPLPFWPEPPAVFWNCGCLSLSGRILTTWALGSCWVHVLLVNLQESRLALGKVSIFWVDMKLCADNLVMGVTQFSFTAEAAVGGSFAFLHVLCEQWLQQFVNLVIVSLANHLLLWALKLFMSNPVHLLLHITVSLLV